MAIKSPQPPDQAGENAGIHPGHQRRGQAVSLNGQVALVTGASSGIGKAIAEALALEGVNVYGVGRTIPDNPAPDIQGHRADLSCPADIEALAERIYDEWDRLDILIHCAGVYTSGTFGECTKEDFDTIFQVNVRAPFLLTKALLPLLKAGPGQVVFVNSQAGLKASAGVGLYAASKFALKGLADSLREEVNPFGIRVLSFHPGNTATPMQEKLREKQGRPYHPERLPQPEDTAALLVNVLKLPLAAEVTDLHLRPTQKG